MKSKQIRKVHINGEEWCWNRELWNVTVYNKFDNKRKIKADCDPIPKEVKEWILKTFYREKIKDFNSNLSLYKEFEMYYFYKQCNENTWIIFSCTEETLSEFLNESISLQEVYLKSKHKEVMEVNNSFKHYRSLYENEKI